MPSGASPRSSLDIEYTKLSSPSVFLVRMLVFLVLCTLISVVLYKQITNAFFFNPGLNALIGAVLFIGIILSFRQVIRLYPEVSWVNNFRVADPGLAPARHPKLLAPIAARQLWKACCPWRNTTTYRVKLPTVICPRAACNAIAM